MIINNSIDKSWSFLNSVYKNSQLEKLLEDAERRYSVTDETSFFSKLVNTSLSKSQPFHRWIRYREGFAGELVKEIIRRYPINPKIEFVLDPMCGSGSTNIACRQLNIDSLGMDVNPFAVLATLTKNLNYNQEFIKEVFIYLTEIKSEFSDGHSHLNEYELSLANYFNSENLYGLSRLKVIIKKIIPKSLNDFFLLGLLAIVEDCSNRKKDGNGLATRETTVFSVIDKFVEQIHIMVMDIQSLSSTKCNTLVVCKSALALSKEVEIASKQLKKNLSSIIFSPPYANSFDYFESYKLELVFGEYSKLVGLFNFRKDLIRNYRLSHSLKLHSDIKAVSYLCDEIWERIPQKELLKGVRDGRTRLVPNMLCAYFYDMRKVILECFQSLGEGGKVHIIVDQSSYVGVPIPTDLIIAIIGEEIGFKILSFIKCRRANTSGQQLKEFPYLKDLLRESIITLEKA